MKAGIRTTSFILMACAIAALFGAFAFVYAQMRDRIELVSANDNERILNTLFAGLRDYDDFGSAIEADETLSKRVAGIAVYLEDGSPTYSWGKVPETFTFENPERYRVAGAERFVVPDSADRALRFVVRASRMSPPPPGRGGRGAETPEKGDENEARRKSASFFFDVLGKGEWVYIEIKHPDYWRSLYAMNAAFPIAFLAMAFIAIYMRFLYLRNAEYRERIEKQKSLVVLGTAASTLAHEIKNPLLAIRLQTGILKKTAPESMRGELDNIDSEVDRLSELTYRINDYLREPRGSPEDLDVGEFARETSLKLCGRDAVTVAEGADVRALVDRERFRSAFENVLRNALESGGDEREVSIRVGREGRFVRVDALDRGMGIPKELAVHAFEPFFTTKSRGTGIGLVISQRFVQAAGGDISLSPRDGGGAVATIRLPALDASLS
jgi:two-component system, NtrC family, sensor histidine kinase HydH